MSSSTAESVLTNSTLRWSSPYEFNDPFDVPRELAFGVSPKDIQIALVKKFTNIINDPPEDIHGLNPKVQLLLDILKQNPTDELKQKLIDGLQDEVENNHPPESALLEIKQQWEDWLPNFRILCLSEHHEKASIRTPET